jgi:hypothetical protein
MKPIKICFKWKKREDKKKQWSEKFDQGTLYASMEIPTLCTIDIYQ